MGTNNDDLLADPQPAPTPPDPEPRLVPKFVLGAQQNVADGLARDQAAAPKDPLDIDPATAVAKGLLPQSTTDTGADPNAPAPSKFLPISANEFLANDHENDLKVAVAGSLEKNQAQAARELQLSASLNLPPSFIAGALPLAEQMEKQGGVDWSALRQLPALSAYMASSPSRAALALPDLPQLADLERRLSRDDSGFTHLANGAIKGQDGRVYADSADLYLSQRQEADDAALAGSHWYGGLASTTTATLLYGRGLAEQAVGGLFGRPNPSRLTDETRRAFEAAQDTYIDHASTDPGIWGHVVRGGLGLTMQAPELAAETLAAGPVIRVASGLSRAMAMGRTIAPSLQRMITGAAAMAPMAGVNAAKVGEERGPGAAVTSFAEDEAIAATFGPVGPGEAATRIAGEKIPSAFKSTAGYVLAHAGLNAGQNMSLDLAHRLSAYADGSDPHALEPADLLHSMAADGILGGLVGGVFAGPEGLARGRALQELGDEKVTKIAAGLSYEQELLAEADVAAKTQMATAAPGEAGELLRQMNQKPDSVVDVAAWHDHFTKAGEDPREAAERYLGPGAYDNVSGGQITIPREITSIAMVNDPHLKWVASEARPAPDALNARESREAIAPVVEAKAETASADATEPKAAKPEPAPADGAPKPPEPAKPLPDGPFYGEPRLANPGLTDALRDRVDTVDELRKGMDRTGSTHTELRAAADKRAEKSADDIEAEMTNRWNSKSPPNDRQYFEERALVNKRQADYEAMPPGEAKDLAGTHLDTLLLMHRDLGTESGRGQAARRDALMSPRERLAKARLDMRGPVDPGYRERLSGLLDNARAEGLKRLLTERGGKATQAARQRTKRAPAGAAPAEPKTPRAPAAVQETRAKIRATKAQLAALLRRASDPTVSGMAAVGPGGPGHADRVPGVLKQLALDVMGDPDATFHDFVNHALEAAPVLRERPADLEKAWDAAGGTRAADVLAKDVVTAADRARMEARAVAVERMINGQIRRMKEDAAALAGMTTDAEKRAYLDGKIKAGLPDDLRAALKPLMDERNELQRKISAIRKSVAPPRPVAEQDAAAKETETKDAAKAKLEAARRKVDAAKKRAGMSDAERTAQILESRGQRAMERIKMSPELGRLHDQLEDLQKQQRAVDSRLVPSSKRDLGPEQDASARDPDHEAQVQAETEKAALDKRVAEVQDKIKAAREAAHADPKERAAALKAEKEAGAKAAEEAHAALPPELRQAMEELAQARKERDAADRAAMNAGKPEKDAAEAAKDRLERLAQRVIELRERSTDPARKAELEKARADAIAEKAAQSEELRRAEALVRQWREVNARHDRELTRQPLTEAEQNARDLRRETERGTAAAEKERALNEKLAAMTPDERREFLAGRTEKETPEAIKAIREASAERLKELHDERERLSKEDMTEQMIAAAEIQQIDRTRARAIELNQMKLDQYRNMSIEEIRDMAIGKLPSVAALMHKAGEDEGQILKEQVRILSHPVEAQDILAARKREAEARLAYQKLASQNDVASRGLREKMKFMGFNLDDPDPWWAKDGAGYDQFQDALAHARGTLADKLSEGLVNSMHSSVALLTVKPASDMVNIAGELAILHLRHALDPVGLTEVWRGIYNHGMTPTLKVFANAMKGERPNFMDGKDGQQHSKYGYISGRKGQVARFSMRLVNAIDQAAKHFAAHSVVGMYAHYSGKDLKLTGDALRAHIDREMGDHTSASWDKARAFADRATFTEQNMLADVANWAKNAPGPGADSRKVGGAILFPFTRVPSNILKQGILNVPGSALLFHAIESGIGRVKAPETWKSDEARAARREQLKLDIARSALGTMVLAAAFYAADKKDANGNPVITGFADRDHPAQLRGLSYARLGAWGQTLGLMVDSVNALRNGTTATGAARTAWEHVTQESLLRNLKDMTDAFKDPMGSHGEAFLVALMDEAVPSAIREGMRNANPDEVTHRGESLPTQFLHSITGGGADRVSPFGSTVTKGTTGGGPVVDWATREINPMRLGDQYDPRPAAQALDNWNRDHPSDSINESEPSQTVKVKGGEVKLSDADYRQALEVGGSQAASYVASYLHAAGIDPLRPTPEARAAIEHALEEFRHAAVERAAGGKANGHTEAQAMSQGAADGARGKWTPK